MERKAAKQEEVAAGGKMAQKKDKNAGTAKDASKNKRKKKVHVSTRVLAKSL